MPRHLAALLTLLFLPAAASAQDAATPTPPADVQVVHIRNARGVLDIVQGPEGDLLLGVQGGEPREVGVRLVDYDPAARWAEHGASQPIGVDSGFDQGLRGSTLSGHWTGPAVAFRPDGSIAATVTGKGGERWWFGVSDNGKLTTPHRLTLLRWPEQIDDLHLQPDGTLVGVGQLYVPGEPGQHPNLWPKLRIFHLDQQGQVDDFRVVDPALHDKAPMPVVHSDGSLWFYRAVAPRTWARWDPSGTRDASFEAELPITVGDAKAWAALPDGGAVAAVQGTRIEPRAGAECGNDADNVRVYGLVRLSADGSLHSELIPAAPDLLDIRGIEVQADGGLLLTGTMDAPALGLEGSARIAVARLDPTGDLDAGFTARWLGVTGPELAVPLSDGRVAVAGEPMQGLEGLDAPLMVIVPGAGGP
jgi:hypothetical protein